MTIIRRLFHRHRQYYKTVIELPAGGRYPAGSMCVEVCRGDFIRVIPTGKWEKR